MSGSIVGSRRRYGMGAGTLALLGTLALALPAMASACIEDGGGEDNPPQVRAAQISPSSFPYEGGTAAVRAEVEDDCGVQQVYGEVVNSEGLYWNIQLIPYEVVSGNAIVYRGEFQVPPNNQESPVTYWGVIVAEDTNGAIEQSNAGEAEEAAKPQFDEAPYVSGATLSPRVLGSAGGQVTIGADAGDDRSVSGALAIVTLPDNTEVEVQLGATSSIALRRHLCGPGQPGRGPA